MASLEAENARLLGLLNEGRLIGSARARIPPAESTDDQAPEEGREAPVETVMPKGEVLVSSEELDALERHLAEVLLPLEEEGVASSMVNAAVRHGETLVTGGYRDANGNFVFTLATPTAMKLDNGEEGIEFAFREIAIPPGKVADLGLDSIAAGARNTLQHGETWTSQETEAVMGSVVGDSSSLAMTAPKIIARPGQQASVQVGQEESMRTISVNAETLPDASGFALRMRVEHRGIEGGAATEAASE